MNLSPHLYSFPLSVAASRILFWQHSYVTKKIYRQLNITFDIYMPFFFLRSQRELWKGLNILINSYREESKIQSEAELRTKPILLISRQELVILGQLDCLAWVLWWKNPYIWDSSMQCEKMHVIMPFIKSFFLAEIAHLKSLIAMDSLLRVFAQCSSWINKIGGYFHVSASD